jgi:hypothetical protein
MDSLDFLPLISSVWSNWVDGTSVYIWEQNLKRTKKAIKEWIKASPHKPREEVENCKKQLEELQEEMESKTINNRHIMQEKEHFQNYMKVLHNEEKEWRLKSRALWLQAGDKNTSFFHKQACWPLTKFWRTLVMFDHFLGLRQAGRRRSTQAKRRSRDLAPLYGIFGFRVYVTGMGCRPMGLPMFRPHL